RKVGGAGRPRWRPSALVRRDERRVHGREVVAQRAASPHHLRELGARAPGLDGAGVGPRAERDETARIGIAPDEVEEPGLREVLAGPRREVRPACDELVLAPRLYGPVPGRESIPDLGHVNPLSTCRRISGSAVL